MDSWRKDFPLKDSFRRADGREIEFEIKAAETPAGYRVEAEETSKSKGKRFGYRFVVFSPDSPYSGLGDLRVKIRKELSVKYLDYDEYGSLELTHDELKGRIEYSSEDDMIVIEADGIKLTLEEFWKILSTYEGFEIEVNIKEQ